MTVARRAKFPLAVLSAAALLCLTAARLTIGTVMQPTVSDLGEAGQLAVLSRADEPFEVYPAEVQIPLSGEPYHEEARAAVRSKLGGKQVNATLIAWGPNGEKYVDIELDGENINAWLVREGNARVAGEWARSPELPELEIKAREAGIGLWALDIYRNKLTAD